MSVNVEYNAKEITQIVIQNTLKMIERRGLIVSWQAEYNKLSDVSGKSIFELKDEKISIQLVTGKLASISQGSPLDDYLSNNINIHKIVVIREASKKVAKQISDEYKNAEFFLENEIMEDIPSKVFIPKHEIINNDERNELLEKFQENEWGNIKITDVMARYYGAKLGDIIKITRASITAGKSIYYRRVVFGTWDILFD